MPSCRPGNHYQELSTYSLKLPKSFRYLHLLCNRRFILSPSPHPDEFFQYTFLCIRHSKEGYGNKGNKLSYFLKDINHDTFSWLTFWSCITQNIQLDIEKVLQTSAGTLLAHNKSSARKMNISQRIGQWHQMILTKDVAGDNVSGNGSVIVATLYSSSSIIFELRKLRFIFSLYYNRVATPSRII